MNISQNIRAARLAAGLTQQALADKLGVAVMAVNRWENGSTPRADRIVPIAAALNVQPGELLRTENE